MGSIPILAANGIQQGTPPSALEAQQRMEAIKTSQQQQQLQGQQIEQQQQQLKDQQAMTQAMQSWDGKDFNELPMLVRKHGGSAQAIFGTAQQVLAQRSKVAELAKTDAETGSKNIETMMKRHDAALGAINAAEQVPDDQLAQHTASTLDGLVKGGLLTPEEAQPYIQTAQQMQPAELRTWLDVHKKQLQGEQQQFAEAQKQKDAALDAQKQMEAERHNKAMENKVPITEAELASKAAAGDPLAEAALKRLDKSKLASRPVNNIMTGNDAKDIADAIENGDQPPTLQGLYRNAGPVRAELARRGVPLAKMETDWKATQRFMTTLNGPQQTRMRQAISTASDSLDKIDSLYKEFHSVVGDGQFRLLNKATLAASKQLPGRAGALATALDAQIADVTAELGNVYMGGNSPTDHSLGLAAKNLSSDWNRETFEEALKQAHANIKIRENSILHAQPAGVSADSTYSPQQQNATGSVSTPPAGGGFDFSKFPTHQ